MNIVFDVETTGINPDMDEILQLSIIDDEDNVIFNSYIRPTAENNQEWPEAERVHGITPEMVKDAPTFEEVKNQVQQIFDAAKMMIAYNGEFDMKFPPIHKKQISQGRPSGRRSFP